MQIILYNLLYYLIYICVGLLKSEKWDNPHDYPTSLCCQTQKLIYYE